MSVKHHPTSATQQASEPENTCDCEARISFVPAPGSEIGGTEVWVVSGFGDSQTLTQITEVVALVHDLLITGCRTVAVERQGTPTASPND